MIIRELQSKDAPLMLEWMHDADVVADLRTDFSRKSIEDCLSFIDNARTDQENLHLAIADENDEYMGTVSLKNIRDNTAEFGITVRKKAMGKGYARYGMSEILSKGFNEYGLDCIYWCVDPVNARAVRFYDKNGFSRCAAPQYAGNYSEEEKKRYYWYSVDKRDQ